MTVATISRPPTRTQRPQTALTAAPLASFLEVVERAMRDSLAQDPSRMGLRGLWDRGGKRIRPRLVFECTLALGQRPTDDTATLAAVAELIHSASLCHDDVLDSAAIRRGHASLPARVGNHRAVLAGDLLVSAAWQLACGRLPPPVAARFAATVHAMAQAELEAGRLHWNPEASVRDCLRVIRGKTAGLFAACAAGAAILVGASPGHARALSDLGQAFGCAFQIRDDVRDYFAGSVAWGKEPLKDLRQGLMTLPMALALRSDSSAARAVRAYFRGGGGVALDTGAALGVLRETGAAATAQRLARGLLDRRLGRVARHGRTDGLCRFVDELFPADGDC